MLDRILQINQTKDVKIHMQHIMDLDRSEKFSYGTASKKIYESILNSRDFIFGKQRKI